MSEVTLRQYCEEIENLVDQGALDAAITHCQHILKIYPKYLPVYGLIGKAALEKGDQEAAADLFSRSLTMNPEDFIARVGMSIASDKDGSLEQAVWHMERAFELAPDNQAVAGELRRLYGRRDGVEPEKVPLTRGALARLYARGGLFSQAINEFRRLLENEPGRADLQIALAETLWRADRRIEAAEISLAVLERLPYCLKANLILGEIWSKGGREQEAEAHLKRAQQIDPENQQAHQLFGERSPLKPIEVRIGRMEYVAPPAPLEQEPDWLQALVEESVGPAADDQAIPDWLQAVAASAQIDVATPAEPEEIEHVPGWLHDVTSAAEVEMGALGPLSETSLPDLDVEAMPDWLAELTTTPADRAAEPLLLEEIPGWLEDVPAPLAEAKDVEIGPVKEVAVEPGALPDWLSEMAPTEEGEGEPGALPDWLSEMAPTEESKAEPDVLPDWLAEMAPGGKPDLAPAEIPDWLVEMAPPEATPEVVADLDLPPAVVPDWLAETQPTGDDLAEPELEETEPAPALVAAETPDWLSELVEAAGATLDEAEEKPGDLFKEPMLATRMPPGSIVIEEPDKETLVYPEGAGGEVTEAEAEFFSSLDDLSPEEAFAAWERMLAESEGEVEAEVEAEVEVVQPELAAAEMPDWLAEMAPVEAVEEMPAAPEPEAAPTEADLLARLEDLSPEEAFAAWERMLAESEGEVEAEVVELATELPQDWMALEGDAALWEEEAPSAEVAAPLALKEELALEPAAELPQDWMALEGDELPLEAKAPLEALAEATLEKEPLLEPAAQEVAFEAEAAEPKEVETWEEAVFELPDWAVAGALETQVGPDWVMLTEEEEAEAHIVEGPPVSAPPTWEPVKEEPLPAVEPEAPARPTWVAAEAEPFAKAPIVKAPIVTEPTPPAIAKPKDDQGRLALARALWDSGQKKDAQAEYERLIKSPLLEDVIGDLERIATDEAVEEPVLRLLGDAYMRDNRLSEALATYRRALASL